MMHDEMQRLRAFVDARKRSVEAAEKRYDVQAAVAELRELSAPLHSPDRFSPSCKSLYLGSFYRDVTAFLLNFVAVHLEICFTEQDREQAFDVFFDRAVVRSSIAVGALVSTLSAAKTRTVATDQTAEEDAEASITQCVRLLEKVVTAGGVPDVVTEMLMQEQQSMSGVQRVIGDQVLISQLSSLPGTLSMQRQFDLSDLVYNRRQRDTPAVFHPRRYFPMLCDGLFRCLLEQQALVGQSRIFRMFADKLVRIGQAQALVQSWMRSISTSSTSTIHRTLFQSLPESCHEQILLQLSLEKTPSPLSAQQALGLSKYRLLAHIPHELCANKHFQYVVAHKLLLRKQIDDLFFWRVLADVMVQRGSNHAARLDHEVMQRRPRPHEPLDRTCTSARHACGESLSHIIASEQPLDFGLKDEDPLAVYGCPVLPEELENGIADLDLDATSITEFLEQSTSEASGGKKNRSGRKHSRKHSTKPFTLDPDELVLSDEDGEDASDSDAESEASFDDADSDSDMSLEAYDLEDDEEDLTAKRPLYLKDLIAGLLSDDDREKTEAALNEAEPLLRRQPRDLSDKAHEVVRALLRLEDKYNTLQFVKLRSQALATACALAPTQTLPYLTSQALEREQLLQSRIDVLLAMTSAAQELSREEVATSNQRPPRLCFTSRSITRTMQSLKNRHWGYRRDPLAAPKRNAFAPYALEFFSPLLFGEVEQTFLAHLLHALASFVECAGHAPQTIAMAKCLLEFAWSERLSTNAEVRRQVLFSLSRVLLVVPPTLLRQEAGEALAEVAPWLHQMQNHDPDAGCREAARLLSSFAPVPTQEMATVEGSPVSSAKLTELGKALDQTSISNTNGVVSPAASHEAPSDEVDMEAADVPSPKLPAKSPKKRGRTDSLKKMLPAPASQRHKQVTNSPQSSMQGSSSTEEDSAASPSLAPSQDTPPPQQRPHAQPAKLMVKDRRGSGMGVPRAHLILNAVKQAPPAKEKSNPRRWSKHEDESLRLAVERSGERNWKAIADQVPGRNHTQCLQRWTKVLKPGLIKGHWTPEEDAKLRELVAEGKKNWGQVASLIPGRTSYTEDEDKIIVEMQAKLGNRWSIIAQQLKGRTEDAVKIRWKSLMRGRRAASKEDKTPTAATASPAVSTALSSPADVERPQAKQPAKASPTRPKNRAPAVAAETDQNANAKNEQQVAAESKPVVDARSSAVGASVGNMPATVFVKNQPMTQPDMAAAMGTPGNSMHNVNELVAASIHNFQMSQRFHPNSAAHAGNAMYPGNPNQLMTAIAPSNQQPPGVYGMTDGGFNVNIQQQMLLQQHQSQQHIQHQQVPPSYQYPPGYTMQQQSMGVMPNYVVPTNFPTSNQMQMQMQMHMPVSSSMQSPLSMPPTPTYSSQAMAMAMANAQYQQHQQHPPAVHQGFSGAPLHPRMASLGTPSGTSTQSMMLPTSSGANSGNHSNGAGVNAGLPPSSAAAVAGGRGLNTPREEWGSSQTPRSQMIMTEGHASAYELFHQQRLRLMLQERDKQGMSLSSAPSPGQALLTKELEANKERQARQAIMQKGWKSAVESMVSFNSVSDLSSLDDQQRFDGLLEKVSLSALDPTDDELLDQTVDIISGGTWFKERLQVSRGK
ncbi:Telomere length regulation protein, conserved domain [Phytophthora cactorum]|nr:Telomere length regulation protein, conserved domain [Phytophthora cactorum]